MACQIDIMVYAPGDDASETPGGSVLPPTVLVVAGAVGLAPVIRPIH
jgi:hypothetical protein